MFDKILFAVSGALALALFLWRRAALQKLTQAGAPEKKVKKTRRTFAVLLTVALYEFATKGVTLVFGPSREMAFEVELWPERIEVMGMSLSTTVILSWCVMAFLVGIAIVLRLTVLRRMQDPPRGTQNVLEIMVEAAEQYTGSRVEGFGTDLSAYIFTVVAFLVGCAVLELFGLHAPTADITMTFALAFVTFLLINWCGIRRKGVLGRIKSLAQPTPVVFPIRVISDCAVPVSMACRLFGNMLGGMIVMDLIYKSLGNGAIGIPSVVGLYFNVFHPLIQAFIFITLTLTFINEATEEQE